MDVIRRLNKIKNRDVVVSYIRNHQNPEEDMLVAQIAIQYGFKPAELIETCKKTQKT